METRAEEVRVSFAMDKDWEGNDLYWYPWHPQAGNILYCMPEKGRQVYVRLNDEEGTKGEAIYSLHENGADNPEMNPAGRYFTTAKDKRMYLLPKLAGFSNCPPKDPSKLEVDDESGLSLNSHQKLSLSASGAVGIRGKRLLLEAPLEVSLVKRGEPPTVINLCNGFDSIGMSNEVTMAGSGEADFPVFRRQEEGKYLLLGVEELITASIPRSGFSDQGKRQVEGAVVNQVLVKEKTV